MSNFQTFFINFIILNNHFPLIINIILFVALVWQTNHSSIDCVDTCTTTSKFCFYRSHIMYVVSNLMISSQPLCLMNIG